MSRARNVADHGWHLSPMLVVSENLAGRNLFTDPIIWDLEAGSDYQIVGASFRAASGSPLIRLRLRDASSVLSGSSDYRYMGIRGASGSSGLVALNAAAGAKHWPLVQFLGTSVIATNFNSDLFTSYMQSENASFYVHAYGYSDVASVAYYSSTFGGDYKGISVPITQAQIDMEDNITMQGGRIQVYKKPALGE